MWNNLLKSLAKRPVSVFLLFSTLLFLGIFSYFNMPLDLFPNIELPYSAIITPYIGASPEEVETVVTKPIEDAISLTSGIKQIQSQSSDGFSLILVEFESDTDSNANMFKLNQSLDMFGNQLPEGVNPIVIEFNPSMIPVYLFGLSSNDGNISDLSNNLQKTISRVSGVALVQVMGLPEKKIFIEIDKEKMDNLGIPADLLSMTLGEGVKYPLGKIVEDDKVYTLSVDTKYKSLDELKNTIIGFRGMADMMNSSSQGGSTSGFNISSIFDLNSLTIPIPVRLNQIADIQIKNVEQRGFVGINGENGVVLSVQKQGGANTVDVSNNINEAIKDWEDKNPGANLSIISDSSIYTKSAINGLLINLILGAFAATLIIFIFLRNISSTIAIAVSIPMSLVISFTLMYFSGLGLDLMTMGGLTMAVGMVVDNSIVVLESIFSYIEEKKNYIDAAGKGGSEVVGAIFASTFTTIVMYFPFVFVSGLAAQIFKYFALAVTFTLIASLLVAIFLVPAFSKFLKPKKRSERKKHPFRKYYERNLEKILSRKGISLTIFIVIFAVSLLGLFFRGVEFIPDMDMGIVNLEVKLPSNTSYEKTKIVTEEISNYIIENKDNLYLDILYSNGGAYEGMMAIFSSGGENVSSIQLSLKPSNERDLTSNEVVSIIQKEVNLIGEKYDAEVVVDSSNMSFDQISGSDIQMILYGNEISDLIEDSNRIVNAISDIEGIKDIETSFEESEKVYNLSVDRNKAITSGIVSMQVLGAIQPYTVGSDLGSIYIDGENIPVVLQYQHEKEGTEWIDKIKISSMLGNDTYVGVVSDNSYKETPKTITHQDGERVSYIDISIEDRLIEDVEEEIILALEKSGIKDLPEFGGQAKLIKDTIFQFVIVFLVGLALMYIIIGAQFESLIYPLVIFFTIPMSLVGITIVSILFNVTINVSSLLGLITLAGITVNNGIVMITKINQLREEGLSKREAIIIGASRRSRPILMTSLTTSFALLPTAFASGPGSEIEGPLAIIISGGLIVGTLFTLFLIPILYDLIDNLSKRFKED